MHIDFWTTKCTRCPEALDKLDQLSQQCSKQDYNIAFVSICCDRLDGAREILEKDNELKWQGIQHYFMNTEYKAQAKQILGFRTVPFYVFLNQEGSITQMGGPSQIDFACLPGMDKNVEQTLDKENQTYTCNANMEEQQQQLDERPFLTPKHCPHTEIPDAFDISDTPELVIDDLDF